MSVKAAHVDRQTGNSTSGDGSDEMLMITGSSRSHRGEVQLSLLRFDRRSRLQRLLLRTVQNVVEAYRITRRLGLPADSIYRKLPYLERAWPRACARAADHDCCARGQPTEGGGQGQGGTAQAGLQDASAWFCRGCGS